MRKTTVNGDTGSSHVIKKPPSITKNSAIRSTRQFTFAELWDRLSQNYTRNRRDFIAAYGGIFHSKVDSLYRWGTTEASSYAAEPQNVTAPGTSASTTAYQPTHKKKEAIMRKNRISSYFTSSPNTMSMVTSISSTPSTDVSDLPANKADHTSAANCPVVTFVILTNDLLTSQAKFIALKEAYQQGIFYAIITLKRSQAIDTSQPTLTNDWHLSSLFQPILSENHHNVPATSMIYRDVASFDENVNEYLAQFHHFDANYSFGWQGNTINDDNDHGFNNPVFTSSGDEDNTACVDSDGESHHNHEVGSDNEAGYHDEYDNFKSTPKRFSGFRSATSTKAYRLETYQQFFSHFFNTTKRVPRDVRLLPGFF